MNKYPDLNDLTAFAAVAKYKSFRKAADERGVSASALSHTIRALEAQMNIRLLNRTTRSVTPTAAGQQLLDTLTPSINAIHKTISLLDDVKNEPVGTLRLNVPWAAARLVIQPLLSEFLIRYPKIHLEIVSDDRLADIVAGQFDAGMRFSESLSPDVIAIPVGAPQSFSIVGTPDYFKQHGIPLQPEDLFNHDCIGRIFPSGKHFAWEFQREHNLFTLAVTEKLSFSDENMILQFALESHGISYVYHQSALPYLQSGQLQTVLTKWIPPADYFYLYYYGHRHVPQPLRVFIDFLKEKSHQSTNTLS